MIKISGYPIIAGAILCALQTATGPPAFARDRWVELTNSTRMTIVEIFISHAGAEFWNVDLLGVDFLAPASSVLVNIDDRAGCRFDVKTVFNDGTTQVRRDVDICAIERYAISYRIVERTRLREQNVPRREASTQTPRRLPRMRSDVASDGFSIRRRRRAHGRQLRQSFAPAVSELPGTQ